MPSCEGRSRCAEDLAFGLRGGDSRAFKRDAAGSEAHDQQTHQRREDCDAQVEFADGGPQGDQVCVGAFEADHVGDTATQPGPSCGLWNRQLGEEIGISGCNDGLLQSMVIGKCAKKVTASSGTLLQGIVTG